MTGGLVLLWVISAGPAALTAVVTGNRAAAGIAAAAALPQWVFIVSKPERLPPRGARPKVLSKIMPAVLAMCVAAAVWSATHNAEAVLRTTAVHLLYWGLYR